MKNFFILLAVLIIAMAVWKLWEYYNPPPGTGGGGTELTNAPSLPPPLAPEREREILEVKKRGPAAFKMLLDRYKTSHLVTDPALAWLELDYVVMISQRDPVQAMKIFAEIKRRTPPGLHPGLDQRIQELNGALGGSKNSPAPP